MKVGKLHILDYIHAKAEGVVHRLLRPYVGRLMEKMAFEGECEDDDLPDCEKCPDHGHCPFEVGVPYQAPPGYMLVRPGPPPNPHDVN